MKYNFRVKDQTLKARLEEIQQLQSFGQCGFEEYLALSLEADAIRHILVDHEDPF
jgi:hypothetical protein